MAPTKTRRPEERSLKRKKANDRERERMHNLNRMLQTVYRSLPTSLRLNESPSKIEILNLTMAYIRDLEIALATPPELFPHLPGMQHLQHLFPEGQSFQEQQFYQPHQQSTSYQTHSQLISYQPYHEPPSYQPHQQFSSYQPHQQPSSNQPHPQLASYQLHPQSVLHQPYQHLVQSQDQMTYNFLNVPEPCEFGRWPISQSGSSGEHSPDSSPMDDFSFIASASSPELPPACVPNAILTGTEHFLCDPSLSLNLHNDFHFS